MGRLIVSTAVLLLLAMCYGEEQDRQPPVITQPDKPLTVYIETFSSKTLECKAEGMPEPTYLWVKNGTTPVSSTSQISVNSVTGDLTFNDFSRRDEGQYTCLASNEHWGKNGLIWAVSMAQPIDVFEYVVTPFTSHSLVTNTGNEFEYLKFECRDKGVNQVPDIISNWYLGESSWEVNLDKNRLFIDIEGNLHFAYLKRDDEKSGQQYRCGIRGRSSVELGSPTVLKVAASQDQDVATIPQFRYSNTAVKAKLSSDAILECFFSGYDPTSAERIPVVTWSGLGFARITSSSDPTKYQLSDDGRRLTVRNVQESDEATYFCQGWNSVGSTSKQAVVLDVVSPPIFLEGDGAPKDLKKPEHSDARFLCNARSLSGEQPPSAPEWYLNGVKTGSHLNPNKFSFAEDKKSLVIKNLSEDDVMCVQCKVSNSYGAIWGNACLNVISDKNTDGDTHTDASLEAATPATQDKPVNVGLMVGTVLTVVILTAIIMFAIIAAARKQ